MVLVNGMSRRTARSGHLGAWDQASPATMTVASALTTTTGRSIAILEVKGSVQPGSYVPAHARRGHPPSIDCVVMLSRFLLRSTRLATVVAAVAVATGCATHAGHESAPKPESAKDM